MGQIYDVSGYPAMVAQNGPSMSYHLAPRARIFRRDQSKAVDLDSFKAVLRYNDYLNDPLSEGNPMWAICSRGDLTATNPGPFGCYDTKVTSDDLVGDLIAHTINGPTRSHGLPPFKWAAFNNTVHEGEPEVYDFDFVRQAADWN